MRETLAFGSPFVRHYAVDSRPAKGHSQADPLGKEGEGQARGAGVVDAVFGRFSNGETFI